MTRRFDLVQEVQHLEARERGTSKSFSLIGVSILIVLGLFLLWAADGLVGSDPAPSDPYNICNEPNAQLNC